VQQFGQAAETLADNVTGASAVDAAAASGSMRAAEAPMAVPQATLSPAPTNTGRGGGSGGVPAGPAEQEMQNAGRQIRTVNDRTFILLDGVWTDTAFAPDTMQTEPVAFLSDAYFALLEAHPELAEYFALGERVIVVLDGVAYEVTAA
jgi:hypothetical protein